MFQTNPETIQYFSQFSELDTPDKQRNSEVFKDHAEKVRMTLNIILDCRN